MDQLIQTTPSDFWYRLAPDLSLVEIFGEDRRSWLQGQATNDLSTLIDGGTIKFCFCEPNGQILAICQLWDLAGRWLMALPTVTVQGVLARFEEMVIMEEVAAEDMQFEGDLMKRYVNREKSPPNWHSELCGMPTNTSIGLDYQNSPEGGLLVGFTSPSHPWRKFSQGELPPIEFVLSEGFRLEAGVVNFEQDVVKKTLPPELGKAFEAAHVSYTKGCYTGQEVLMRIHSQGHTNYSWVGLMLPRPVEIGNRIVHPNRPAAGSVTSVGFSHRLGHIAAARVRREASEPGSFVQVVTSEGSVVGEVREMPMWPLE